MTDNEQILTSGSGFPGCFKGMKKPLAFLMCSLLLGPVARAVEPLNPAALPTTRNLGVSPWWAPKNFWLDRIGRQREAIREGNGSFDLVLIGDSITHNWEGWPDEQWREILKAHPWAKDSLPSGNNPGAAALADLRRDYTVLNLGIGGDTTGEVLWRLRYARQLDGYRAKCISLMIGTNNREEPAAIAEGIGEILREIRTRQPEAVVLLLPIFPRGETPADKHRVRNAAVNAIIRGFADGERVLWVDFTQRFLQADGTLTRTMMPDLLHPGPEGYRIWAEELRPYLEKICNTNLKDEQKRKDGEQ